MKDAIHRTAFKACMCTINSFVGYAIVKMKTSSMWWKRLDHERAYIYLAIDYTTQFCVSTEIVVNVNTLLC